MASGPKILRLKVTLLGIKPPIWRRLEVPADLSLHGLHACLQAGLGWSDTHLHEFEVDSQTFAPPDSESGMDHLDSRDQSLAALEGKVKAFGYNYDFGDDWRHTIEIEAWIKAEEGVQYPRCTAGARACPPEDCGGDHGYMELIEVLRDRRHDQHREMKEWVGPRFNTEAFDLQRINAALKRIKTPRPKPGSLMRAAAKPGKPKLDPNDKEALLASMTAEFKSAGAAMTPELGKALLSLVEMRINRMAAGKKSPTRKATR